MDFIFLNEANSRRVCEVNCIAGQELGFSWRSLQHAV